MRKIGNIELQNPFILAPMAGITNSAFRTICQDFGAALTFSEMISDKGLLYNNKNTTKLLYYKETEHPLAIQLFGSNELDLLNAYKLIEHLDFDILDINMGCPVKKVVNSNAGSALLKDPSKIELIIKTLKNYVKKPLTIKIRAGWDMNSINCDEVAVIAEKEGVDAITIHTRCRSQLYRGNANLDYIDLIRKKSNIFLIGSGDIKSIEDALNYLNRGCDAVMIGRASLGNPWIFKELNAKYQGLEYLPPTNEEVIEILLKHARLLIELNGEKSAMVEMRSHAVWYFKKLKNSKEYRKQIVNINTFNDLNKICVDYLNNN